MPSSPLSGSGPTADRPVAGEQGAASLNGAFAPLALAIYAVSGATALAWEVLWTRMLSLLFGVSIFGVVVTVAAFMAGLGAGSLWGASLARGLTPRRALRGFALIEAGIACFGLLTPWLAGGTDRLLDAMGGTSAGGLQGWYAAQGVAAFLMLFVPALGMGLGFPLMLRALAGRASLGAIYGLNTLGGVAGALLPLALLPALGWSAAAGCVAALGAGVAAGAWMLARRAANLAFGASARAGDAMPDAGKRPDGWTLAAYAGVGAASLALEVAWTRLYGMLLLRTEYVLAVILAVFLAGVAGGSLLARPGCARREAWLNWLPAVLALAVLAGLAGLPWLAGWAETMQADSLLAAMLKQGAAIALCTLPTTLLLGAWLPLLAGGAGRTEGAWLYGANSLGAALGALFAGFAALPAWGATGVMAAVGLALFACGMRWAKDARAWLVAPALAAGAWWLWPLPPVSVLLPAGMAGSRDLMVHEDAVALTHVVEQADGQRVLLSDLHRMDASTDPTAVAVQRNQARLPLLLRSHAKQMLFLGLGTGITASASLALPGLARTGVELSLGAIRAAGREFAPVNGGVMAQMRVVRDDARRFLRTDDGRYDLILGDLFHPDMAGRAALLSVQQFRRGRAHLRRGGLYVQWLALNQFDVASLESVLAGFRQVFPHAWMFVDGFRLALVGSRDARIAATQVVTGFAALPDGARRMLSGGEGVWTWLGRYWGRVPAVKAPAQDEWRPVIEFALPRARFAGELRLPAVLEWLLAHRPHAPDAMRELGVRPADREAFMRAWAATSLGMEAQLASMRGREGRAERLIRLAWRANPRDRWAGFALADRMYDSLARAQATGIGREAALHRILAIRPDHVRALKALLALKLAAGRRGEAERLRQRILRLSPLDADMRRMTLARNRRMLGRPL